MKVPLTLPFPVKKIILLALFTAPLLGLPQAPAQTGVASYTALVSAIREVRRQTEARIEAAVRQEKVREAWETGKLIHEHILLNQDRAEYGKQVIEKLAKDLGASQTELSYMLQFARAYSNYPHADNLSWSDYRDLLALNDKDEFQSIVHKASAENWSRDRIRAEVRKRKNGETLTQSSLEEPAPGEPGVYRITKNNADETFIDLGFSSYLKLSEVSDQTLKKGQIVKWEEGEFIPLLDGEDMLYTYQANVLDVLDGDTLRVEIDLGFGFTVVQKLRLRGLDAPELISEEGKRAKEYLEEILTDTILIRTSKSDKYDRYLADIWAGEQYVNQALLDEHHAVAVSE